MPEPLFTEEPTHLEKESIQAWIKDGGLAKSIVLHMVSIMVLSLIPDDVSITAREIWELLENLYDHNDISLQFTICS